VNSHVEQQPAFAERGVRLALDVAQREVEVELRSAARMSARTSRSCGRCRGRLGEKAMEITTQSHRH
jgi:hypothetical protein